MSVVHLITMGMSTERVRENWCGWEEKNNNMKGD